MLSSIFSSTLIGSWWLSHFMGLPYTSTYTTHEVSESQCEIGEISSDISELKVNLNNQGISCLEFCSCSEYMYENSNECQCSNSPPPPYTWYIRGIDAQSNCHEPNYNVTNVHDENELKGCTTGSFLQNRLSEDWRLVKSKPRQSRFNRAVEMMDIMSLA
ncbi:uncharacterized protein IL334_004566 [Kwoniella shivajii]|uniref:Uncharacterized protein n=1 Tax=Kwoniella shivajii TaxID=564305 RepID=A0ABZ1D2L8_9TREE|nr:hypothetical protein IL334_004566 [Kwoniella shivajii]